MGSFKKASMIIWGIALWGYIFALFFIEGTYHPFMKKDADTVVEKTKPVDKQRTQIRTQTYSAPIGISIYTTKDSEKSSAQQLYFSALMPKDEAIKSAAVKCREVLVYAPDDVKCKEVAFFTKGCYARYRIGNGHTSSFGPTEEEAQAKAKQKCDVMAENSSYSCLLDTNRCIIYGRNQGTRNWDYMAVAISKKYAGEDGITYRRIYTKPGGSKQQAKNRVAQQCLSITGKPCESITAIEGDQCLAVALNGRLRYSVRGGGEKNEDKLKAEVRKICTRIDAKHCLVKFYCPG